MKKILAALLLFTAGLNAGAQSIPCLSGSLATGVIAFYPFGSGSLADASGGGHTLNNSTTAYPTTDRFGSPQCAYHFDAVNNDQLNIPYGPSTLFVDNITTAPFAISLWYQPIGPRSTGFYELLIGRNSTPVHCPDTHGEWSIGLYDCRKAVAGFDMYNEWQNSSIGCDTFQAHATGHWHHLVCTFDGATRSLYVDNVLYPVVGGPCGSMAGNIGDLILGEKFTGDLDDIIIYNRSLSAAEVAGLFGANGCCGVKPPPLPCNQLPGSLGTGVLAFYPFGYGSLTDQSGAGNNLMNPTSAVPTADRFGNPTCAYHFDRTSGDFLTIPFGGGPSFLDTITTAPCSVSMWYQPLGARPSGFYELLMGRNTGLHCPDTYGEWSMGLYDCRKAVVGFDKYNQWQTSSIGCSAFQASVTGSWHHLAFVYDGTTRYLYVDNVLFSVLGGPCGTMSGNIGDFFLGKDYTGDLDDIVMYNRALSPAEVTSLYTIKTACCDTATPPPLPCNTLTGSLGTGVMSFYPFGHGSLSDVSGGGHDLMNTSTAYPTMDRSGNPKCAYHFDKVNGDFLTMTAAGSTYLDNMTTAPFSISLWYQPIGPRNPGDYELLVGRNVKLHCPDTYGEWSIGLYDCRQAVAGFDQYSEWQNVAGSYGSCNACIAGLSGTWHHLVCVYDGSNRYLYVDGTLFSVVGGPCGPMSGNTGQLLLGTDYTGDLDDVIFYKRALSYSEVLGLYKLPGSCCDGQTSASKSAAGANTADVVLQGTGITIYPNPSGGVLTLEGNVSATDRNVQIEVVDLLGKSLYTGSVAVNNGRINTGISLSSSVANGVYLVKVKGGSTNEVLRFTLKR